MPGRRLNCRSSAFQGFYHPESTYLEKLQQPSSRASTLLSGDFRTFNTHNKCTGVCRFVRGIPVGIGCRVADLWGFCGARRDPDCLEDETRDCPTGGRSPARFASTEVVHGVIGTPVL